ncbi:hypothetical protein NDU88_002677 [Pleurodeles waltl]|uniref:Uncharacterized protein n=1 Tax=Pleurodeles waltl TaxID=8319 RepID=A0AAV7KTC3_PLEWA|nr:hypothetical protein NDU88_002677 [Pleurodeles waltl]
MEDGKALVFTDLEKLQQFIAKRGANGQRQNTQLAWSKYAPEGMDDAETTLVPLLRPWHEDKAILQIQDDDGGVWNDVAKMVEKFHDYYTGLYKSRSQFDEVAVTDYLAHIVMSWLTDENRLQLMAPLRPEEIRVTLADMTVAKAPGTNRLMMEFYKAYQDILIPHLVTLFEEMAADGCMPPTMREALLMFLLKT